MAMRAVLVSAVIATSAAAPGWDPGRFVPERVVPELSFRQAVQMLELPDGSGRWIVAERAGVLRIVDRGAAPPTSGVWLDISDRVATARDFAVNGFAFDPDFAATRLVYIHYNWNSGLGEEDPDYGSARIARFVAAADFATADAASEAVVYQHRKPMLDGVAKPLQDHNGGNLEFGPDGMLYLAFGDGGSDPRVSTSNPAGQDPHGNGQSTTEPFGSILRIDVRGTPDPGLGYRIPPENPFFGGGPDGAATRKEIWAYGLRNPWRMTFDPNDGALLCADVGAKAREEVNVIVPGGNYGWSTVEGDICFPPGASCDLTTSTLPIATIEWAGTPPENHSISGGYVETSGELPTLQHAYLYSDYIRGAVYALRRGSATVETAILMPPSNPAPFLWVGFGRDNGGRVYLLDFKTAGGIYRLAYDPAFPTPTPPPTPSPTPWPTPTPTPDGRKSVFEFY